MTEVVAPPAEAASRAAPRPPPPQLVTSCPRCEAPAQAAPGAQTCAHCKAPFVLVAGALLDEACVPPEAIPAKVVKVRSSGLLARSQGVVGPAGISHGTLDPITGRIPMDSLTIPWGDIYSIALWRRPDWVAFFATLLLLGPIVLGLLAGTFRAPILAVLSVPLLSLWIFLVVRAFRVGVQQMRVCGSRLVLKIRYDQPLWRRKRFVTDAFRRAGVPLPAGCERFSLEA